ncbi:uncharacterized protein LOC112191776 [Rosa chinensis]|uniref:uncharacterized protein LOC112191776 n=1 Tax=Rosa chinensis TaxID=74649 RepID=UPI000D08F52E|nr:uncharacterized protein LOC112191776 [Rosa chinensis]
MLALQPENLPPPISNVGASASIPVQIIEDSSPEPEENAPLSDAPPEEPITAQPSADVSLNPDPTEAVQEPVPVGIPDEAPIAEGNVPTEEVAVADPAEPAGEGVVAQELAPQVLEVGAYMNAAPEPVAAPIVEPQEIPAAVAADANAIANVPPPEPPNRLERLVHALEVAPPGVTDEARDSLQRLLGPDILLPGAPARAQEYLMVLRRERTITEAEFVEIYELLQNLHTQINEITIATTQARQVQAHYRGLAQQAEVSRDSLGDRAIRVRDLRISQNHLRTHIQDLQAQLIEAEAQLVVVTPQLEQEEPQIEQPLAALEAMSQNLAQAREAVRQAERAAADACFRVDEHLLRLTHAGRKL